MIIITLDLILFAAFLLIDSKYLNQSSPTYDSSLAEVIVIYSLVYTVSTFVFIVLFLPNNTFLQLFAVVHILTGFGAGGYKLYTYKYDTSNEGKWTSEFTSQSIQTILIIFISVLLLLRLVTGIIMKIYGDTFTQLSEMVAYDLNEHLSNRVHAITS